MKIAVFGDVHGNLAAYQAVANDIDRWGPDLVVSTGDIVNRGPSPKACLDAVERRRQEDGWRILRGNHEDYVIHQASPEAARSGPEFDTYFQSYWTLLHLDRDVEAIRTWEDLVEIEGPGGSLVRITHGSVLGSDVGVFPGNHVDELAKRCGDPAPDVFCAGHTHVAFIKQAGGTLVVNAGSVGIPFDGDWRAGYARLVHRNGGWDGEIVRLAYDRARTFNEYQDSGYLTEAGPIAWLVLAEYVFARSQLFAWHRDYYDRVQAGEIDIETSVREQLKEQGIWGEIWGMIPSTPHNFQDHAG
ncbi:MAG TPA: metallophosphoesterase family protein [Anaerolineales bacterium]|nr:metallophosphoesterase family protein [Anaerolineales bacterium]